VEDVHHVHVWRLDEHRSALEAHVRIGEREVEVAERVTREVKNRMASAFDIGHATLEVEYGRCSDTSPAAGKPRHPPESSVPNPPVIASDC
jgi:cobalt-zinc-cadmium efflux system protein